MCCAMLMLLQSMIEEDQDWLPSAPLDMDYDDISSIEYLSSKHLETQTIKISILTRRRRTHYTPQRSFYETVFPIQSTSS